MGYTEGFTFDFNFRDAANNAVNAVTNTVSNASNEVANTATRAVANRADYVSGQFNERVLGNQPPSSTVTNLPDVTTPVVTTPVVTTPVVNPPVVTPPVVTPPVVKPPVNIPKTPIILSKVVTKELLFNLKLKMVNEKKVAYKKYIKDMDYIINNMNNANGYIRLTELYSALVKETNYQFLLNFANRLKSIIDKAATTV